MWRRRGQGRSAVLPHRGRGLARPRVVAGRRGRIRKLRARGTPSPMKLFSWWILPCFVGCGVLIASFGTSATAFNSQATGMVDDYLPAVGRRWVGLSVNNPVGSNDGRCSQGSRWRRCHGVRLEQLQAGGLRYPSCCPMRARPSCSICAPQT